MVLPSRCSWLGFTLTRLRELSFDDKYCFPIRVQLMHLLRVMHVSPQLVPSSCVPVGAVAVAVTSSVAGLASAGRYKGQIVSVSSLSEEVAWGRGVVGQVVATSAVPRDDAELLTDCSMPVIRTHVQCCLGGGGATRVASG